MTTVVVGTPSSTGVMLKVSTEYGMPIARMRAVRPIAFGGWLIRRLMISTSTDVPVSFASSSVMPLVGERLGDRVDQLVAGRGVVDPGGALSRPSAGRGLTGSGPVPRFCGTGGFFGLPESTTLKPTDVPYM